MHPGRCSLAPRSLSGPRDRWRRNLLEGALDFVVAHEYAHLVNVEWGGGVGCVSLDLSGILGPLTEAQVINAQRDEAAADVTAWKILLADADHAPLEHVITAVLGGCLSLAAQMAVYHMSLAMGSEDYGWSHPVPDMRLGALFSMLAERGLSRVEHRATFFLDWVSDAFCIDKAKSVVAGSKAGIDSPVEGAK